MLPTSVPGTKVTRRTQRFHERSAALAFVFFFVAAAASAAPTPNAGTLSPSTPTLAYSGGLVVGANADESTCQENVTCESYTLTLAPGDYTGKRVQVKIQWLVPANDYDLYIHANTLAGPVVGSSGGSAPGTSELANLTIDPPVVTTAKTYALHVVAFTVAPGDAYAGSVSLVPTPPPRQPVYLAGTAHFSDNVTLKAPITTTDGEPSCRVDVRGNCYVGGIRGVPAGVDLWRFDLDPASPNFDPGLQNPTYLGQPDAFLPQDAEDPTTGGADGGGDIDISVSFPAAPSAIPVLTITSLAAAEVSSARSTNRGANFTLSPAVVVVPSDDRQWNESHGDNVVYLYYRAPVPGTGLFVARSTDGGLTYPVTGAVSPTGTTPGYIDVDHANGRVYVSHTNSSTLMVGNSSDNGLTWKNNTADNTTQHGTLFDPIKVGDDGTVYTVWSDGANIYMAHSTDGGNTFGEKVRVNDNAVYKTNMFPWLEAGSAGRVCVVWYGSTSPVDDDGADWVVLFSQTLNATAANPTFRQQVISDHVIHGSNISTGGLTGSANRNLLDYFQVAVDPQGAAVVAFTDDHNDYDGNVYVTRQLDGASLYASGGGSVPPATPPPLPQPAPSEPEVSDFLHDAVAGLLQPITSDNPFDILWVDYSCESTTRGEPVMVAKMKLSQLFPVPPAGSWRVSFTANAPGGVSDRGDQFYLLASSTNPTSPVYTWGTAVRGGDGNLTYTERGNADFGAMDSVTSTITMKVAYPQLRPFATHGTLDYGTVFHGLRGRASTAGANGILDITRGGTSFTCGGVPSGVEESRLPLVSFLGKPMPNPMGKVSSVQFAVAKPGWVELSVFDVQGRRVRSLLSGTLAAGRYERAWDGRTDRFSDAAAGVYFFVLNSSSGVLSHKVILSR